VYETEGALGSGAAYIGAIGEGGMDIYHGWFDLKAGTSDTEFARHLAAYMDHLKAEGRIAGWRLTRRKLGLGPEFLPDFHVMIEVTGLAQLDLAFGEVATRAGPVEGLHQAVNSRVSRAFFALYRDFPDPVRVEGEEKF
jgi:hypothetical protein